VTLGLRAQVFAAVPFVLLLNADQVTVTTELYGNLSGIRRVQAEGPSTRQRQIEQSMPQSGPKLDREGQRLSQDRVRVLWCVQVHDLAVLDDVETSAIDVVQEPLRLRTWYKWQEHVKVELGSGSEAERKKAEPVEFEYRLTVPGKLVRTSPTADSSGSTATWKLNALKAAQDGYELSATAVAWRWDVILLLVYVLGYAAYRIVAEIAHRAQLRPRKI
jgi:hypothetical protein